MLQSPLHRAIVQRPKYHVSQALFLGTEAPLPEPPKCRKSHPASSSPHFSSPPPSRKPRPTPPSSSTSTTAPPPPSTATGTPSPIPTPPASTPSTRNSVKTASS